MKCIDHAEFVCSVCPDCGLEVDAYGNTEAQFDHCCFPDCGCDGARLCMAPSGASEDSLRSNVEGMWSGTESRQVEVRKQLILDVMKGKY